jgi:hypothetical protein
MNKRGFVVTGTKKWIGLFLGILFMLLSFYILTGEIGAGFSIGILDFLIGDLALAWIVLIGAIYLVFDAVTELGHKRVRSMLAALIGLLLGLIPVLNSLGIIPFTVPFAGVVYALVLIILGGFLIWDFTGG